VEANQPARTRNTACRVKADAEYRFARGRGFPSLARFEVARFAPLSPKHFAQYGFARDWLNREVFGGRGVGGPRPLSPTNSRWSFHKIESILRIRGGEGG
jgi:hypothetical protein